MVCLLLSGTALCFLTISSHWWQSSITSQQPLHLEPLNWTEVNNASRADCRFHTCFDISRCVFSMEDVVGVYIGGWYELHGPETPNAVSRMVSLEYAELVEAVKGSHYHVSDPSHACIFLPPLDTLSQDRDKVAATTFLNSLPE